MPKKSDSSRPRTPARPAGGGSNIVWYLIAAGVAGLFAWPVGYVFASNWLKEFAYRIRLSPWIFAGAHLFVLLFAVTTMAWQSSKAARAHPVESLRYE